MRISDWSSDVCSSDLGEGGRATEVVNARRSGGQGPDLAQARARLARGNLEVVVGLEAHPELGRLPKATPETHDPVCRTRRRHPPTVRDAHRTDPHHTGPVHTALPGAPNDFPPQVHAM